jgi:hypothetical protein
MGSEAQWNRKPTQELKTPQIRAKCNEIYRNIFYQIGLKHFHKLVHQVIYQHEPTPKKLLCRFSVPLRLRPLTRMDCSHQDHVLSDLGSNHQCSAYHPMPGANLRLGGAGMSIVLIHNRAGFPQLKPDCKHGTQIRNRGRLISQYRCKKQMQFNFCVTPPLLPTCLKCR